MRRAVQGSRGRTGLLWVLLLGMLLGPAVSCGEDGTVVLVTVEGLDSQAMELGVVVILDGSVRHPFPRQSVAASLSPSQQFGVLMPAGLGGAVTLEVDAYRGDCQVQSGTAPVALAGEPPIQAKIVLGAPTMCAPLMVQVLGAGKVTSPDAQSISCGPEAECMYWLDANRTYTFDAAPTTGDTYVEWQIDGLAAGCEGQTKCSSTLPLGGHRITVAFRPLCDRTITLSPAAGLTLPTGTPLRATWGIAGQEAWAVGDLGTVVRYRAATNTWDQVALKDKPSGQPIQESLSSVWGVGSPATLFIGGRPLVGGSAYMLAGPALVTGSSPTAITVTVSQNLVMPVNAVTGFDLTSVWAVGKSGSALKWNPTAQKFETTPAMPAPSTDFNGAWVSDDATHTLVAVNDNRQIFLLADNLWTTLSTTGGGGRLLAATGSGDDFYAVGTQSNAVRATRGIMTTPVVRKVATGNDGNRNLAGVWAGSGYVFAVGDGASVFCSRTNGTYWTRLPVTGLTNATFYAVYGSGNRLWVVGQNSNTSGVVVEGKLP